VVNHELRMGLKNKNRSWFLVLGSENRGERLRAKGEGKK